MADITTYYMHSIDNKMFHAVVKSPSHFIGKHIICAD